MPYLILLPICWHGSTRTWTSNLAGGGPSRLVAKGANLCSEISRFQNSPVGSNARRAVPTALAQGNLGRFGLLGPNPMGHSTSVKSIPSALVLQRCNKAPPAPPNHPYGAHAPKVPMWSRRLVSARAIGGMAFLGGWGGREEMAGEGVESGLNRQWLHHRVLPCMLSHAAWHRGPHAFTGKIAGTDARTFVLWCFF